MPKFTYSAAKGIEQSSGSGFFVNGAALVENQGTITVADGDNESINAFGTTLITLTDDGGTSDLALAAGTYIGQRVVVATNSVDSDGDAITSGHDCTLTDTDGNNTYIFSAVSKFLELVWSGSDWIVIKNTI